MTPIEIRHFHLFAGLGEDGVLRDYLIVPEMHAGTLGVRPWDAPAGTVTGNARPMTGAFSVAARTPDDVVCLVGQEPDDAIDRAREARREGLTSSPA